jgi:sugar fermentation stimulation protein A
MTIGSYILILQLEREYSMTVGSLGIIPFPKGRYAYVGSAMGGLESRLRRHFSTSKKRRWHIDYLLEKGNAVQAFYIPSEHKMECFLNRLVSILPESLPIKGFGASDCTCRTHLHRISEEGYRDLISMFGRDLTWFPWDLLDEG